MSSQLKLTNKTSKTNPTIFARKKLFAILLQMTATLYFLILLYLYLKLMALAEDENQFTYNGFHGANLHLDGVAQVHPNGLLQLTNTSKHQAGHAFYQTPIKFNTSSSSGYGSLSFSTNFIFVMVPEITNFSGHGIAFTISPSMDFTQAVVSQYLGLFNSSNNGLTSNHLLAIEFDTIKNLEFSDINDNHVGIDVNGLNSTVSAPVTYYSNSKGINKSLDLISGNPMQVWIDYDEVANLLNVAIAPIKNQKPNRPLLSIHINLSLILLDYMYVGFSSATGSVASNNYILGWSFHKSGQAQSLELAKLPSFPKQRNRKEKSNLEITVSLVTVSIVLIITILGIVYFVRRKKYEEIHEVWEKEYGPQRFSYKDLYRATKGFKDTELIGAGGFGKVYRGVLPSSKQLVAVKKVSHDSKQGMKEFVAEIASMGRLRHMNLVQLLGYCRRRGEMLLVYDYMPNGSLDKFLFSNKKRYLNWAQRCRILKGVASALVYLHEEWEQVVLHRDVKASNVLLDDQLYGRLGDFGLARLYDHGAKPQTTHVVGTVGYLAPELTKTGKATTSTDVFAFGAFLLEVACGRRPIDLQGLPEEMILVDWVFEKWKQGVILETCDPILEGDYLANEMELVLKLGLLCSHSNPATRPSMKQVMQYLDGDTFFPETILEGAGIDMLVKDNKTSTEFFKSVPSSSGNYSVYSASSSDSILCGGR
ncbi:L-type lectin-domain containing receptor kinase IV.2-like [Camellia sinensis]|uniref:L-type lectin-domain containing receptor kinase IV.2-like n=1 Tax=Camellia sinensis TaxID=4442 RepID=UPI001035EA7B|nr:L-type lectin-domain containing receptor kinase IV.2-like [Camellia sinensis]